MMHINVTTQSYLHFTKCTKSHDLCLLFVEAKRTKSHRTCYL